MKATLSFNLDDEGDSYKFFSATHAVAYRLEIDEIDNYCRGILKHGDGNEAVDAVLTHIRHLCSNVQHLGES